MKDKIRRRNNQIDPLRTQDQNKLTHKLLDLPNWKTKQALEANDERGNVLGVGENQFLKFLGPISYNT